MNRAGSASVPHATLITVGLVLATMMNSLDLTICNVALPHMKGSVSASSDQITWVLTSYIVAVAVTTPLTGWLAGRFGRRIVLRGSIVAFVVASVLCGISSTLAELVLFRLVQGVSGAALVPITQAILLDINPPERHGPAMAALGTGAVIGPIMGPFLGGFLTEHMTWRWVFFINIPIGLAAFATISLLPRRGIREKAKFDFLGYAFIALAVGCFQLVLDRGQEQDWFDSWEIRIELLLALMFLAMFIIQMRLAENRFVDLALFTDRNFLFGCTYMFLIGSLLMGTLALMPPMLEGLMGYPVMFTGMVMMPRGIGAMVSMFLVGRLIQKVDPRALILTGLASATLALTTMKGFSLQMDYRPIVFSGFVQGFGIGFIFVPLTTLTFATIPSRIRNEGAAFYTLIRNLGSAIGISMLSLIATRNTSIVHARLVEGLRPDRPAVQMAMNGADFTDTRSMALINAEVTRQAGMVAYTDVYWALLIGSLAVMPLVLMMKRPNYAKPADDAVPIVLD